MKQLSTYNMNMPAMPKGMGAAYAPDYSLYAGMLILFE